MPKFTVWEGLQMVLNRMNLSMNHQTTHETLHRQQHSNVYCSEDPFDCEKKWEKWFFNMVVTKTPYNFEAKRQWKRCNAEYNAMPTCKYIYKAVCKRVACDPPSLNSPTSLQFPIFICFRYAVLCFVSLKLFCFFVCFLAKCQRTFFGSKHTYSDNIRPIVCCVHIYILYRRSFMRTESNCSPNGFGSMLVSLKRSPSYVCPFKCFILFWLSKNGSVHL